MKTILVSLSLLGVFCFSASCLYRQDERVAVIQVPGMKSPECVSYLEDALNAAFKRPSTSDFFEVRGDAASATITVRYSANALATLNILYSIADAGFDASLGEHHVQADPTARSKIPAPCR